MAVNRLASMRIRVTAVAVLAVALGLIAAAALIVALVRHTLASNVRNDALQRAQATAALVTVRALPAELPTASEDRPVVQVVDRQSRVIAANAELRGLGPLLRERPAGGHPVTATLRQPPIGDGAPYWVVGINAGSVTVYAANSMEPITEGVDAILFAMSIAVPLLLVVVGGASWVLVGRTLTHLAQAAERQRRFVNDASHELRSPLSTIRTRAEVGLAHPGTTDWMTLTRDLHREASRLDRLVEELLTLSRVDGVVRSGEVTQVDLDELVLLEVEAITTRGEVSVDLSGFSAVRVPGRPEQLRAVVRNLLDNAERHAKSRIIVTLSGDRDWAELVVLDDGPGIPATFRARVYDRFFRLQEARDRDSGGAGLGLAIVRDVVATHGGRVWLADSSGGAEFHVRLPMAGVKAR